MNRAASTVLPAALLLAASPLSSAEAAAAADPRTAPQGADLQVRSEHLEISYPAAERAKVALLLTYADDVYTCVDTLLAGALPRRLRVRLVSERQSASSDSSVVVSVLHENLLGRDLAAGLARLATRELVGAAYGLEGYRFFIEGLAAWVGERCEHVAGPVEPRWLWAAYAHMEAATYLEYLEAFEAAGEEMGKEVISGAGYTFVDHFVERHGRAGLWSLLAAMSRSTDLCSAVDDAGFGCEAFLDDWWAALDAEAAKRDFSIIPQVYADLLAGGDGEWRELSLRVRIINPEAADYPYFLSLVIDGERSEGGFHAEASDYLALVRLGRVPVGATVLWDVAVWSDSLKLWRRSGWQNRIIE